jgi:KaiC/GvpD/RAD55 family RecA-like ATPase
VNLIPSEKIEPIILKLALTNPKYLSALKFFEKEWFQNKILGEILFLSIKYNEKFNKLPTFDTLELLATKKYQKDLPEVLSLLKTSNSLDISKYDESYIDEEFLNYLRNGGIYWTIMNSIDEIQQTHNVNTCIDKLKAISSLTFNTGLGFDYFEQLADHIEYLCNPEARLSTGWDDINEVMAGGLLKDGKCLAIFMGETHVGKSLMLSNMAANLLRDNKFVLIISLEMSEMVYAQRIDAHLTLVNVNQIQNNTDKLQTSIKSLQESNPNAKLIIKEFPPDTVNCNVLKTYIDDVVNYYKRTPDVIIIDYLGLLVSNHSSKGENSYQKYKDISTQMRALSYIYNTSVVTVQQKNRSGYDNTEQSLSQTADSMGVPHNADFIGALWQKEGDREAGIINCTILKNRLGGQIGKNIQMEIDYTNLTIKDLDKRKHSVAESLADIEEEFKHV